MLEKGRYDITIILHVNSFVSLHPDRENVASCLGVRIGSGSERIGY